jgi:hypothetical protein
VLVEGQRPGEREPGYDDDEWYRELRGAEAKRDEDGERDDRNEDRRPADASELADDLTEPRQRVAG